MKKLRLIKPWRLRTVRQRLEIEVTEEEVVIEQKERTDPSSVAPEVFTFRKPLIDKRVGHVASLPAEKPVNAPFSDAIFAWLTKEKLR